MKIFLAFLSLHIFTAAKTFSQMEKQIPVNWKIFNQIDGDFNNDKIKDSFVMIDSMDTKNTWVCAKRILLIFHGTENGLILVDKNTLIFSDISRIVDADVISLTTNVNIIRMWIGDMNVSGYNGGMSYTFRFQNKKWYAIGCSSSFEKLTNDDQIIKEDFSHNFITGKHERIFKIDSKIVSKTVKKKMLNQYLFSQYNGVCE